MKLNCGETFEEKEARLGEWHIWFAWHPVRIGPKDCRWLEKLERKGEYWSSWDDGGWDWKYRPL